jgi:type VI secretion system protein ImpL
MRLRPELLAGFGNWVAPLEGAAAPTQGSVSNGSGGSAERPVPNASQYVFEFLPQGSPGLSEYTIEIDGQQLRYRNAAPQWQQFVVPNAAAVPGARITARTLDGRNVEVFNEPGRFAFQKLFQAASNKPVAANVYEKSWSSGPVTVTVHFRIISQPGAVAAAPGPGAGAKGSAPVAPGPQGLRGTRLPPLVVGSDTPVLAQTAAAVVAMPTSGATAAATAASGARK